jgi:hypothetical protein
MPDYDPGKPQIWRSSSALTEIAALVVSYVDDLRATAGSEAQCWLVMHQLGVLLLYLGIQVAARKTRPPAKSPGTWTGSVVQTDGIGIGVHLTQEKWDKTKALLGKLHTELLSSKMLDRKWLESAR